MYDILNVLERNKKISKFFPPDFLPFRKYMQKYVIAGQATDDNIILRMCFACWITKATGTHSQFAFPQQKYYVKAPQ